MERSLSDAGNTSGGSGLRSQVARYLLIHLVLDQPCQRLLAQVSAVIGMCVASL